MRAPSVLLIAGERLARYGFGDGHPLGPNHDAASSPSWFRAGSTSACRSWKRGRPPARNCNPFTRRSISTWSPSARTGEGYLDGGDTPAWRGIYEAAADVAGGTCSPPSRSCRAQVRRAFSFPSPACITRRAVRRRDSGFNDCGVAVEMLRRNHGLKRIAYVDVDTHPRQQRVLRFENDPDLIFADITKTDATCTPAQIVEDDRARRGRGHQTQRPSARIKDGRCGLCRRAPGCSRTCAS